MRIPSMLTYPLFPDWVFVKSLPLDPDDISEILLETKYIQKEKTHYGFIGKKNSLGRQLNNIRKIVGDLFYTNVASQFQISPSTLSKITIESTDAQLISIDPCQCFPLQVSRLRWYQSLIFLQADSSSSKLYFEMMDSKLHLTPVGFQESRHYIDPEIAKVVFWPAHILWGLSLNQSHSSTVVLFNNFVTKPKQS